MTVEGPAEDEAPTEEPVEVSRVDMTPEAQTHEEHPSEARPRRRRGGRRRRRDRPVVAQTEAPTETRASSDAGGQPEKTNTRTEADRPEAANTPEPTVAEPTVAEPTVTEPPSPKLPTPELPTPELPTPELPTPELPTPKLPTPELPTPKLPTPEPAAPAVRDLTFDAPAVLSCPEATERKIAMFCDLENLALGVRDSELKQLDVALLLERLREKGKIVVKRAYADWERYSEYKRAFHEAAVELIDIPQRFGSGKNGADIKLVVDAMDVCYAKSHLDTFVIVSGDSDFSPLASKLKENDKYVIGIGVKSSASNLLIDNCDEFIYYEDMWRDVQKAPRLDHLSPKDSEVFSLMIEAVVALVRENKDVLWGSMVKQTMKRKRPSFSESYYGYATFSELLQDAEAKQVIKLTRDQRSGGYVVTGFASPA